MDAETALRLIDLDQRLKGIEALSRPFTDSGSSFPTSQLFVGRRFFRTDLGLECYWDGAYWLTTFENVVPVVAQSQFSSNSTTGAILISAVNTYRVTRITMSALVVTTNNGSNYWTIQLQAMNDAFSDFNQVMIVNTSSMSPNQYYRTSPSINSSQNSLGRSALRLNMAKVGSPGDLRVALSVHYRFVIT